ncbi:aminoglycoside phosphotransferase family protein [Paenibacillus doosanensis]|uniref:aminoglycoside phosphotransferase family protein n=1 Tax=Paenibacillus doosanensis TaxID=1229154 RepID=UPI00217FF70B|nr:aminoglycoside phosphotransferase family protein [Paenibacillus doosanensis]MCS7461283.1 aminoglycoside phosphotransferase family protein [Paenibacillus doosanensis]
MNLFNEEIGSWQDWSHVSQSLFAFTALVNFIFQKENLPPAKLENLPPATNAVFKSGDFVIKIFVPREGGMDQTAEIQTEQFSMQRANRLGIRSPKLIAHGFVEDKYRFAYMIMEYVHGIGFGEAVKSMTQIEKSEAAKQLRKITDIMNTPCPRFNDIDAIADEDRAERWNVYPDDFRSDRLTYITSRDYGEKVHVHGDLNSNNIIITDEGKLCMIDFADAVLAPKVYEDAYIAAELFQFDSVLLRGYFGDYSKEELVGIITDGLLIHDFGGDVVSKHLGKPEEFHCINDLRKRIYEKLTNEPSDQ